MPIRFQPGKNIFFSSIEHLDQGTNTFTITAVDGAGEYATRTVVVERIVPAARDIGSRMSMAIIPPCCPDNHDSLAAIVYDGLLSAFVNAGRFHIVARGSDMEAVLEEMALSQSELVDETKALRIGRLVTAETVLTASVLETDTEMEITTRLINTETSTVMAVKDVYCQSKSLAHIDYLLEGLALKFKQAFPLVEGAIVDINGKEVFADIGGKHNIKAEMKVIIFREEEERFRPRTGTSLGRNTSLLGEARIFSVHEHFSKALLLTGNAKEIHAHDLVVTK